MSDPTDILFSLKKLPILTICDDSCTLLQHVEHRFPTEAKLAFGETKGCFEKPSNAKLPNTDIDCPEILPLAHQTKIPDKLLMDNPSILLHPDALSDRRYVMGTRMQMRPSGTSHKKKSCSFHDLDKSKQGVLSSSMNQEALQNTRKAVISYNLF